MFMYSYCYVRSVLYIPFSLCCSVYRLCVNVYLYYCQRVSTQLQLTNVSYFISRKAGRCVGLTTLSLACTKYLEILGA